MSKQTISVFRPIGKFMYKGKQVNGIEYKDFVATINSLPEDTTELTVLYDTPGGSEEDGRAMYAYLMSLKPKMKIISEQVGEVASAGTFPWLAGDIRRAKKGKEFMIHFPWSPHEEGDQAAMLAAADRLGKKNQAIAEFYNQHTGVTIEGLMPLMAKDTTFGAEDAVKLKFATETYEGSDVAYHYMEKEEKTVWQELLAFLKKEKQGKSSDVAAAPPAELMGKPVMVNGVAAPDGVYSVKGGVVTALEALEEEGAEQPAAGNTAAMKEVLAFIKEQKTSAADIAAEVKKQVDEQILAFKNSQKGSKFPPGFKEGTKAEDSKEYDRAFKSGETVAMKKNEPEKYQRLYFAKYGVVPKM